MGTIDRRISRSGIVSYRARARLKGFPPQTANFRRKTDAKKWIADTESAIRDSRYFATAESKRHTLSELLERYERDVLPTKPRNARNQLQQLKWWKTQLGAYRLADVTPAKIAECRDQLLRLATRRKTQRSPATVVRYLALLSHVFSIALKEWGWVDDNPLRKVTTPKEPLGRSRFLDDDDRKRLLQACNQSASPMLYPIVVLAIGTGMRKGEIMGLRWPDVDVTAGRITLHHTKNGERRGIPLVGLALDLLVELFKTRRFDTDLVFPSPSGPHPLLIDKAWSTALGKVGICDFRFHDLRHCAASYLLMNGASLAEAGEILGHKSTQMTKRYAHLAEGHTQRVVKAMNEKIFATC